MEQQFKFLFSPLKIGPVTVPNRILSTSHHTMMVDPETAESGTGPGFMGDRYAAYLGDKARGGTGLIIAGQACIHPTSEWECFNVMKAYDKQAVPGFKKVTDAIHKHGAVTCLQLFHTGAYTTHDGGGLWPKHCMGPSGLSPISGLEISRVMNQDDINELIEHYGISAKNGIDGGFDGVEIHSTHGYLPQQFLSPLTNRRTDKYGGSLENRMRFLNEVLEKVRKTIGSNKVLGVRLVGDECVPGGLTPADCREIATIIESWGLVDYLNVSLSNAFFNLLPAIAPMYMESGYGVYAAANIREAVKLPVFTIGRITDPVAAEKILADGHADMVGMTRAIIADPELGNKAKEGKLEDIRNCVGCTQFCLGHHQNGVTLGCTQNPAVNRERIWGIGTMQPAVKKKKVIIAGGGPGGLETAWVAAARGHDVILYEKSDELGGQIKLSRKIPGRADTDNWASWRINQVGKYPNIKVKLNTELTADIVEQEKPDAVVIATGLTAVKDRPNEMYGPGGHIPGYNQDNVVTPEDILSGKAEAGNKVIIMDYVGGIKGLAMADMLAQQGKQVELVALHYFPAMRFAAETCNMNFARGRAAQSDVKFTISSMLVGVDGKSVTILDLFGSKTRVEEDVDTVVIIIHGTPNDELYYALRGKAPELYIIGDSHCPTGEAGTAIYEGHKVGREL